VDTTFNALAENTGGTCQTGVPSLRAGEAILNAIELAARTHYFVDAATGDDANSGKSWATAKKSIQAAIDSASDGERILVNDGEYEPISIVNNALYPNGKAVEIVSVNGAEKTIIDGSLTRANRVAYLGRTDQYTDEPVGPQSVLEGFTIRGGRQSGGASSVGAGVYGGTLRHCIITDNDSGSASGGGAAYAILDSCKISGNRSGNYGGGAFICTLFDCTVENNEAEEGGGGTAGGRLDRCIVRRNSTAGYGGGHQGGDAADCLFEDNSASLGGGAVAGANLSRCTVVNNRTDGIGGGAIGAVLHGSIVWNNTAGNQDDNCNTSHGAYNDTNPVLPGTGNISTSPMFVNEASGDYRLSRSSPCIDVGFGPTDIGRKDLAGEQRWQGARIDMGAYETSSSATPSFIANDLWVDARNGRDTKSGLSREEALATINAAVAKAADGVTIHVLPGNYAPFTLDGRTLTIQSTDGAEKTIVNGAGVAQCAWLGAESQSVLEGLTLCNGYVPMDGGGVWGGGTLRRCIIRDNVADECGGGAVLATLDRCIIHNNSARNGSGGGTFYCDLSNCLVYRNSAVTGGGVWSGGHFVVNCTVVDNSANKTGGGIMSAGYVTNSIVWNNSAPAYPDIYGCDEWHLCSSVVDPNRGSITLDPLFVAAANDDYRLQLNSPCINAGSNAYGAGDADLDGNDRIIGGVADIGAYETVLPTSVVTLDRQDGTGGTSSAIAIYRSAMPTITVPTLKNHRFKGYFTGTNGTGTQYYTRTGASARNWDRTSDTTLYALWCENQKPTFATISPDVGFIAMEIGATESLAVIASDLDGDALSMAWSWCDKMTGTWQFAGSGSPFRFTPMKAGNYTIKAEVSDGDATISKSWNIKVFPVAVADYGEIPGSELVWSVAGTTLTISGDGQLPSYAGEEPPYQAYANTIRIVVVEEGVTSVGQGFFSIFPNATTIVLPSTLEKMWRNEFSRCDSLEMLYLPQRFVPYLDDLGVSIFCYIANTDVYNFVRRLYYLCLEREPEWTGCATWSKRLTSGERNGAMAAYGFFLSAEMTRRNLSNAEYVEVLYRALMDRAPDSNGKAYWVDLLDNGVSRAGVFRGFAESAEFTRICGDYGIVRGNVDRSKLEQRDLNYGVTKFVARCYTKALNRNYDVKGLNSWCGKINSSSTKKATAIQVARSFLKSAEFQRRNLSNAAYVDVLYQTFLGHAPDAKGRQSWLNKLNSGMSRDTVMAGFYNSKEFTNIMASYGIK
jgi:predicted outer membrane repeat protein